MSFEGRDSVKAMATFRIPLGAPRPEKDRPPSFGFTVKREIQFSDPLYERGWGSYPNSTSLNVDLMDLRFGMNGKLSGFDVGGFDALTFGTRLNAAADEDGGVPTWIWWVGGGVVVLGIAVLVLRNQVDECDGFFRGPSVECGDFDNIPEF